MSKKSVLPGTSTGNILENGEYAQKAETNTLPVLINVRPVDDVLSHFDAKRLSVASNESSTVNDLECWKVEHKEETGIWSYWISPQADFAVVRYAFSINDEILSQCDFEFDSEDRDAVWMPIGWKDTDFVQGSSPKTVRKSVIATVKEFVVNQSVPEERFAFVFPEGALVHEHKDDQHVEYLYKDNNEKEIRRSWSDSRIHVDDVPANRRSVIAWLIAVTLLLGATALFFFIRRTKSV